MVLQKLSQILRHNYRPSGHDLVLTIRASVNLGTFSYGQQLHSYVLKSGFNSNVYVSTSMINFYLKFEALSLAHELFVEIPEPSVVSWNSLISGYVRAGKCSKALGLFLQLDQSDVFADEFSFTAALAACGQLRLLQLGKSIHSKIVKFCTGCAVVVSNCLIDLYGKCGVAEDAVSVFRDMRDRDDISWNSVISACIRNGLIEQSLSFLHEMPEPDTISYNEVISGLAQFGYMEDAIQVLVNMPVCSNSSSWNSIITGYVNHNRAREAMAFFSLMHSKVIHMDKFTFSSILSGIARVSDLKWGTLVHCCTGKKGLDESIVIGTALVDMYSKCGQVKNAERIFNSLPERNLVTWNAMLSGFAHGGDFIRAIQLFERMKLETDCKPDEITLLNILSACSHNQMPLNLTIKFFESMIKECKIQPTTEHICSVIRLMGQHNELGRAEKLIYELGFGSCGSVWRALLGACGMCGDAKVAEAAAAKMIVISGDNEFVYVILSNLYACYGKWGNASAARQQMRRRGVWKEVGTSWLR